MSRILKYTPIIFPLLIVILDIASKYKPSVDDSVARPRFSRSRSILDRTSADSLNIQISALQKGKKSNELIPGGKKELLVKLKNTYLAYFTKDSKAVKRIAEQLDTRIQIDSHQAALLLVLSENIQDIDVKSKTHTKVYLDSDFQKVLPEYGDYHYILITGPATPFITYEIHESDGSVKTRFTPLVPNKIHIEEIPENLNPGKVSMLEKEYFQDGEVVYRSADKIRKVVSDFKLKGLSRKKCVISIVGAKDHITDIEFNNHKTAVAKKINDELKIVGDGTGLIKVKYSHKGQSTNELIPCISGIHLVEHL